MADLLSISLHNVRFRAYHGLYPEERQKGNDFVVNMRVGYIPRKEVIMKLEDTIDYSAIFEIINACMQKPVDLLETLVQTMARDIHERFPIVREVMVTIEKLNPPIDGFSGSASVSFIANFA